MLFILQVSILSEQIIITMVHLKMVILRQFLKGNRVPFTLLAFKKILIIISVYSC